MEEEIPSHLPDSGPLVTAPLVLPPNMKGWLAGPQRLYIEENHLQAFCKIRLEDPTKCKDYAKTASNALIAKFGWRYPYNIVPVTIEPEGPLSWEDARLKGVTVHHLYRSMLSWLTRNTNRIDEPMQKKSAKEHEDATSLILHRLVGGGDISVKGRLPFQAWASQLSEDSELVQEYTKERDAKGLNQRQSMGLYTSFFSKAFGALPDVEQAIWKELVESERAEACQQREEANDSLGKLLSPAEALNLMDRMPKILGPLCEQFAAMAGVAVCLIFGGPDPREGGRSYVKSFSYGQTKEPIPQKFSANEARYDRCMGAFSEFVAECFDEEDEAAHALPTLVAEELPLASRWPILHREIDPMKEDRPMGDDSTNIEENLPVELEGGEEREPKKRKKRSRKKGDDIDDVNVETAGGNRKKRRKKRDGDAPMFAMNERGKKTTKVGPQTAMNPKAALAQIQNTLAAVMPVIPVMPAGTLLSDCPIDPVLLALDARVSHVPAVLPATTPVREEVPPDVPNTTWQFPGIPITGPADTPNPFAVAEAQLQLQQPRPSPTVIIQRTPFVRTPSPDAEVVMRDVCLSPRKLTCPLTSQAVVSPSMSPAPEVVLGSIRLSPRCLISIERPVADGVVLRGVQLSTRSSISVEHPVADGPEKECHLLSPGSNSDSSFGDARLMDASKWSSWFHLVRKYLDGFELGHDWTHAIIAFTLWEGRNGFTDGLSSLPTLNRCLKQVAWWSQQHRTPVPNLDRSEILVFGKKWWSWWRALQPTWQGLGGGEGPVCEAERGQILGSWEKLDCPGKNGMYSILACLGWWKQGIDNLSGNKGRLVADWETAMADVGWVLVALSESRAA